MIMTVISGRSPMNQELIRINLSIICIVAIVPCQLYKATQTKPLLEIVAVVNDEMVEEWELKEQET